MRILKPYLFSSEKTSLKTVWNRRPRKQYTGIGRGLGQNGHAFRNSKREKILVCFPLNSRVKKPQVGCLAIEKRHEVDKAIVFGPHWPVHDLTLGYVR